MRVVHLLVRRTDFARMLGEMREWLDRNDRPFVRFETKGAEPGTINVRVHFDGDDLAERFRKAFDGSYGD